MNAQPTILITGGAGFIGSRYVRMMAADHPDWEIRVLDLLTYSGNLDNLVGLEGHYRFIQGDIADPGTADLAVKGCHTIVNFAAESHVDRSLVDSKPFARTNVQGVRTLTEAAITHGVERFIQVSTDEVYGDLPPDAARSRESDPLEPTSPYATSKAEGEGIVHEAHANFHGRCAA